jgi:dolichyl-diphosphooligosaccharide--protein glycosyltransferase
MRNINGIHRILLFGLMAAALLLRLMPYGRFVTSERIYFFGGDPYDHMRRVFLILRDFPHVPTFNFYQGYPVGSSLVFSPLFDFMIALAAKAVGLGSPAPRTVEMVGVLAPAFIGALTLLPVYFLALQFMGQRAALVSAAVFGVLPAFLMYSFLGQTDNNSIEPFLAALYSCFLVKTLKDERHRVRYALLASLTGLAALFMWRGATLFWVMALGVLVAYLFAQAEEREKSALALQSGVIIFSVKGLLLFLMGWQGLFAVRDAMNFREISYFHALFAVTVGLGFAVVYIRRMLAGHLPGRRVIFLDVALFLVPFAAVSVLAPSFVDEILKSYAVMGQGEAWHKDIIEYKSILLKEGKFSFLKPTERLSVFFWLVPVGIAWFFKRLYSSREERADMSFLLVSTSVFFLSTLSHMRFGHTLSVYVAILAGLTLERLVFPVKDMRKKAAMWVLFALLIAPVLLPVYRFSTRPLQLLVKQKEFMEVMDWMKENTPPTSHYPDPRRLPEYGVLAEWSLGSWIENVAFRPTVATPFGAEIHGLEESIRFMLSEDEDPALRILTKNRVRYVVVTNLIPSLDEYARILNVPFLGYARLAEFDDGRTSWVPGERYFRLVSTSLLLNDGMPFEDSPMPLPRTRHFRLLYEAPYELRASGLPHSVSKIKVFEYVKGATLLVRALPGETVSVSVAMRTNQGRLMKYQDTARAGPEGRAVLTLPYPTDAKPGVTSAEGAYVVSAGDRRKEFYVTEEMAVGGASITLEL